MTLPIGGGAGPRCVPAWMARAAAAAALMGVATLLATCWWIVAARGGQATLPPADKAALICEAAGLPETCTLSAHRGTRRSLRVTLGSVGSDLVVLAGFGRMVAAFIPSDVVTGAQLLDQGFIKLALTEKLLTAQQAAAAAIAMRAAPGETVAYLERPRAIRMIDNATLGVGNAFSARVDVVFVSP